MGLPGTAIIKVGGNSPEERLKTVKRHKKR